MSDQSTISERKKRQYTPAQLARKKETAKRWRAANPEKSRETSKRFKAKNRVTVNERQRQLRAEDPSRVAKARQACRRWRSTNLEYAREKNRQYSASDPERRKRKGWLWRLKKYGLTEAAYNAMLAEQGGVCGICRRARLQAGYKLAVDHCHTTGKVRGILCTNCNTAIGKMRESPTLLRAAADYLEMTRGD